MALLIEATVVAVVSSSAPDLMKAVQAQAPCSKPNWSCISERTVKVPLPKPNEVLIEMRSSSVNPIDADLVEPMCHNFNSCSNGTIGIDGAGIIVQVGSQCSGFKAGDEVWFIASTVPESVQSGTYAEYAVAPCEFVGLKPQGLGLLEAGTIPVAGMTSLICLQAVGKTLENLTVVVTSGQGGTGFLGVQLAKALGAAQVITAATGPGIDVMKSLGADLVVDFRKEELFDALPSDSVDIVFDNFGRPGTADKAMHTIRNGGSFLVLLGGNGGKISDHPKAGVQQVASCRTAPMTKKELDLLSKLYDAGTWKPHVMPQTYGLAEVPQMFTRLQSHGVIGKIALDVTKTNQLLV
eukprot:TRINITY_DN48093_c0_g1_i1.p1 TRINITY_DN48093_c0_g1~~TRINITY_DN48093_c0_g1_i1.p1  ORF type:complete len:366 (-),score=76.47 TRINITY_DN48093_c0_g1_i1:378-1433(-)